MAYLGSEWYLINCDLREGRQHCQNQTPEFISVGWTNPYIEEWFNTYFGAMPTYQDSVACCNGFAQTFRRITGQKHVKSDKDIYEKLNRYGDEKQPIKLADRKYNEHISNGNEKPTEMCPCTTVHHLVKEIKSKIPTV